MQDKINELLNVLAKQDQLVAEAVELALAFGESGEPVLEKQLVRRLETLVEETAPCCVCIECTNDDDDIDFDEPVDDDCYDDEDDDDFWDDYPEEDEEPEPDELSEQLGLDVGTARPIELATAIVRLTDGNEDQVQVLLGKLRDRGLNIGQIAALVEDL